MSDVDVGFNSLSEPVDYEDFVVGESSVDLRAFHVVGGVLHFNLLQMPPQPKVIRGWTITQCMCCSVLIDLAFIFSRHISPLSVFPNFTTIFGVRTVRWASYLKL